MLGLGHNEGHFSEDEEKNGENEVQKLTDEYIEKVEKILEAKENDIMTV